MANITVTATAVIPNSDAVYHDNSIAGSALTIGQIVYLKDSDQRWYVAQMDSTTEQAGSGGIGVAMSEAVAAAQPIKVLKHGSFTMNAGILAAEQYILSALAGSIADAGDQASSSYLTYLGYGSSTTVFKFQPVVTGIAKA